MISMRKKRRRSEIMPLSLSQVTFAFVKHLWQTGERERAFDLLSKFVHTLQPLTPAQSTQDTRLLAR